MSPVCMLWFNSSLKIAQKLILITVKKCKLLSTWKLVETMAPGMKIFNSDVSITNDWNHMLVNCFVQKIWGIIFGKLYSFRWNIKPTIWLKSDLVQDVQFAQTYQNLDLYDSC